MSRALRSTPDSLFPSEGEIARRMGMTAAEWTGRAIVLERSGFPAVDPLMGARYWPACRAFFDRMYGLATVGPSKLDGMENLDALG